MSATVGPYNPHWKVGDTTKERFIEAAMLAVLEKLPMPWLEDERQTAWKCASVALAMWQQYQEAIKAT